MFHFYITLSTFLLFGTPSHGFYCIPCPLTQPCPVPASCTEGYYGPPSASPCQAQPPGGCPCQQSMGNYPPQPPTGNYPPQSSIGNFPCPLNMLLKNNPRDSSPENRPPPPPSSPPAKRFLTSLFSIPGAVADSLMSGEINI